MTILSSKIQTVLWPKRQNQQANPMANAFNKTEQRETVTSRANKPPRITGLSKGKGGSKSRLLHNRMRSRPIGQPSVAKPLTRFKAR